MTAAIVYEPDLTWTGSGLEAGLQIEVDDGRITRTGRIAETPVRLERRAVFPGFVNAHSHAFQRALRGQGEIFPKGAGTFWTWREAMYSLVQSMSGDTFYDVTRQAFEEMLNAGITAVGEFHYFHHGVGATDFANDSAILAAAHDSGIRIVLLNAYYRTGGIGQPLEPAQRRFDTPSVPRYWAQLDALHPQLHPGRQHLGVVAHSIRAVSREDLRALHDGAVDRRIPFHMHVEEQRREIDECMQVYGKPPMGVILDTLDLRENFTAVHCTHTAAADLRRFLDQGGTVCICPLTEANLGDGVPDLGALLGERTRVSLGTDSNARISMTEEMRWLEYGQRLRHETRGKVITERGDSAAALLEIATAGGARVLGLNGGTIEPGRNADLVAIDLEHPALSGATPDTLPGALVLGCGNGAVADVMVAGRWRRGR